MIVILAAVIHGLVTWKESKSRLYALMLQAKSKAKNAVLLSGQQQEEWVVKHAMQYLPASFRIFLSEDVIRGMVRWLYKKGKDYLDDGKINNSVK